MNELEGFARAVFADLRSRLRDLAEEIESKERKVFILVKAFIIYNGVILYILVAETSSIACC